MRRLTQQEMTAKASSRYFHLKALVMNAYGGSCTECGTTDLKQLILHHRWNDGRLQRKKLGTANNGWYMWLKRNNFPQDLGLEVRCKKHHGVNLAIEQQRLEEQSRSSIKPRMESVRGRGNVHTSNSVVALKSE